MKLSESFYYFRSFIFYFLINSCCVHVKSNADNSLDNPEYYMPTEIEWRQGVAFAAPRYWGVHVRRSKSLRVAFLGGSQTSRGVYLDSFRESIIVATKNMSWSSAVYNEGLPGEIPNVRSFKFFALNASQWPNVICFEPCINCLFDPDKYKSAYFSCSTTLDNVKYFINREYKHRGLDPPYYFFIEFFKASELHWDSWYNQRDSGHWAATTLTALPLNATKAIEISDTPYPVMHYRGSAYAPFMMDMARFYGMPVLSVIDVLYPSFVRFFLTHAENELWPCSADGFHTSVDCAKLVGTHILTPFFLDQMAPRESDKLYEKSLQFSPYPVDVRMFKQDQYKDIRIIASSKLWGGGNNFNGLTNASNTHWSIVSARGHDDGKHRCYGTNSSTSVSSQLRFSVSSAHCHGGLCRVKVEYLHSWDTSYIASAKCDLYTVDRSTKELDKVIDSVSIVPNKCGREYKKPVTGTYLCPHILNLRSVEKDDQYFSIECRSAEIGKLACIGGVEVFLSPTDFDDTRKLSSSSSRDNPEFYEPTPVELQQGTAFAAPTYWGVHMRRIKSLRVAFLGGPQTSDGVYVDSVNKVMKEIAAAKGWVFAVYKEFLNISSPVTTSFQFFTSDASQWPTVICIEPCSACVVDSHDPCSYRIDNTKNFINKQYERKGIHPPYYMFLEYFAASDVYNQHLSEWRNIVDRVALPLNISRATVLSDHTNTRMFSRGAPYALYLMDMARFYGIPVLSVTDVLYPSYVRFHLTHAENERWPYTSDGMLSSPEADSLVAEHILKPFFLEQMAPRESDKLYEKNLQFSPYPVDVRMFPSNKYID